MLSNAICNILRLRIAFLVVSDDDAEDETSNEALAIYLPLTARTPPGDLTGTNPDLKIVETGPEVTSTCAVGLQFFVTVNNTSDVMDYIVELAPDQCCLRIGPDVDCDVLEVVGTCVERAPRGKVTTLKLVAPILDPIERHGYCTAYLDSKRADKLRGMRDPLKIPFDTRIRNKDVPGVKHCKHADQDPLNNCRPVDCEVFYNGKRNFYNHARKRCVEVPTCVSDDEEMPNVVYDPISNICVKEDAISNEDLDYIKSLIHGNGRVVKDIVIIKNFRDNSTGLMDLDSRKDAYKNFKYFELDSKHTEDSNGLWDLVTYYVYKNKCGVTFLGIIVLVQCCLIFTMVYCLSRSCICSRGDTLVNKYFNYRQDASVTTPLIGTTNIDTETTCQFMSESSNVDKKIQCYKACHKENAKISMSDDILSKCLNRRNWDRKQAKSEDVDLKIKDVAVKESKSDGSNAKYETHFVSTKKQDQKVNFENEKRRNVDKKKTRSAARTDSKKAGSRHKHSRCEMGDSEFTSSEQEIKCHSYNNSKYNTHSKDLAGSIGVIGYSEKELKCHSYNYMDDGSELDVVRKPKAPQNEMVYKTVVDREKSDTGQASAQASFSNDSIDDFLSERGMLFLTGENISKYSLSNDSVLKSRSSVSSKTPKKNIVKNVLSFLKRTGKSSPSSDPGVKKSKEMMNLELLHMSRASMYSSSNNGTEFLKNKTKLKDSKTSF